MTAWTDVYRTYATDTWHGERALLVLAALSREAPLHPSLAGKMMLQRVSGVTLRKLMPRNAASYVLSELARVDAAISIKTSPLMIHFNLYGPEEFAHTPSDGWGNFISFNLASARVRSIFVSAMGGCGVAQAALVDLYAHEKAHLMRIWGGDMTKGHDDVFYSHKRTIRAIVFAQAPAMFRKNRRPALPSYRHTVKVFKAAGASSVGYHGMGFGAMI